MCLMVYPHKSPCFLFDDENSPVFHHFAIEPAPSVGHATAEVLYRAFGTEPFTGTMDLAIHGNSTEKSLFFWV